MGWFEWQKEGEKKNHQNKNKTQVTTTTTTTITYRRDFPVWNMLVYKRCSLALCYRKYHCDHTI